MSGKNGSLSISFFPFSILINTGGREEGGGEYIYVQTIRAFAPTKGLCNFCGPPPTVKERKKKQKKKSSAGPLRSAFTYIPSPPTKDLDDFWRDGGGEGDSDENEGFVNGVCEG